MALGNLAARFVVAAVVAPILIVIIYLDRPEPLWGVTFVASLLAMHELFAMTISDGIDRKVAVGIGGAAAAALYWLSPAALGPSATASILGQVGPMIAIAIAVVAPFLYFLFRFGDLATVAARMTATVTGVVYGGFLTTFLAMTKRDLGPFGDDVVILILLIAWVGDTMAYFAGRFLGHAKLYPAVSPKKTWAGAWGGLAGSVLAVIAMKLLRIDHLGWVDVFVIAIPAAALGQMGDLAESLLKRSVGVKDSGSLLPGHGGILDRIDAVLFIAPYVYIYLHVRIAIG